ncbi:MAG: putative peptidoglycan lipid II flippase [Candidatus Azotimanducaceae bacterium]|jgi:putative peptidoglycan lipid II flippase
MSDSESLTPKAPSREGLVKSTGVVSSMTLLSRVLGVVRDMVIANYFGASAGADSFFLAFRIPNFFRRLFGEGAFSQAFVPVLSQYRAEKTHEEVRGLVAAIGGSLGINLIVVTLLGVLGAPLVIGLFAAGYVYGGEVEKLTLATEMLRLTFPYVFLICMTAFAGSVLNSYGRFGPPAFTPVLLNICLIGAALGVTPYMATPVMALAWGVLLAGILQLLFQFPFLAKERLLVAPKVQFSHPGVKQVMTLMLPALLGVSVGQINLLLDTVLASFLETGSISWLYYSDRLLELPLALFGITIATVILPSLSRQQSAEPEAFQETLVWAVKVVFLIGVPASIALVVLSESLITTLFYQGELTQRDVQMAGASLAAYGLGLLGHMLVKVLAPGYFSRQDTKTPVRFGIITLIANMVLNLCLVWHFQHVGLALATSLAAFLNAGLLWMGLVRTGHFRLPDGWWKFVMRLCIANGLMLWFLLWCLPDQTGWFAMAFWQRLGWMLTICVGGAVVYGATLLASGMRLKELMK